jgi:hypothetical protein
MDCLQLAVDAGCSGFVAHRVSQRALTNVWEGKDGINEYELV